MEGDSGVCLSKEPWISGDYKKFNNNWGWVDEADYSASIQAFSHWTYDITGILSQHIPMTLTFVSQMGSWWWLTCRGWSAARSLV